MTADIKQIHIANNVANLQKIAQAFAVKFHKPTTFVVNGKMGAGKTTFIKKICAEFGITETNSPTFSLVNEYENKAGLRILHFDLYRIESLQEALDFGFEEYLDQVAYIFIEWPEKVMDILESFHSIDIKDEMGKRIIEF